MTRHSPLIRLQAAQRHYECAQAACPHWDYENGTEEGYGCCHELDDAQRELTDARIAFRKTGGNPNRVSAIRRAGGSPDA